MASNVWLLDVDGVLNAFEVEVPRGYRRFVANGFDITYHPSVVARIIGMHKSGLIEVRWLTTWEEDANTFLCETFGWPLLSLAGDRLRAPRSSPWWKSPLAKAVYDEGHRVVWTDDDLDMAASSGEASWVHDADPHRLLTVTPDPYIGLTDGDLDAIERWLGRVPCRDAP